MEAIYSQTQFRKTVFQKVRFLGHPVLYLNSNQRNELVCYIAQNFLHRIAQQTGDKPESDVITEEKGLLHCHHRGVKPRRKEERIKI